MFKKAQGMSINTIIIAIIVLVVLVVLVMIFTGYFGGWTRNVVSCESQGGSCASGGSGDVCVNSNIAGAWSSPMGGKCASGNVCCPQGTTPGVKPE